MGNQEFEVNFIYDGETEKIKCKSKEKLKDICLRFTSMKNLDFDSLNFTANGELLSESHLNQPVEKIQKGGVLAILVSVLDEDMRPNKEIKFIFKFKNTSVVIQGLMKNAIKDICAKFANKVNKNLELLSFKCENKILDLNQNCFELANEVRLDNNNEIITIKVEENNNIQTNPRVNSQQQFGSLLTLMQPINSNNQIVYPIFQQIQQPESQDNSCCKTRTIIIIIVIILIIVFIIILLVVVAKSFNKESNSTEELTSVERCEQYSINSQNLECLKCNSDYNLYKGECILYSFKAKYLVDYNGEKIQLFNRDKIKNIYAMEINDEIQEPVSEFIFNSINEVTVTFFLYENTTISLSNMFENNEKLIYFSFNVYLMKYFYINNIKGMFKGCSKLEQVYFHSFEGLNLKDISFLFYDCSSLSTLKFGNINTSEVKDMSYLFFGCQLAKVIDMDIFNTEKVTNMSAMFANCISVKSIYLSTFNTKNVIDMSGMFFNCYSLTSLDLRGFNTSNVINMLEMFQFCSSLISLDIRAFNTKNVIDMGFLFGDCNSLISLNLGYFDTKNVENMRGMFYRCFSLKTLDLSNFNTQNVIYMDYMFCECQSLLSLNLNKFQTQNVIDFYGMFYSCKLLKSLDLSNFNTLNIENMSFMFGDCNLLESIDLSNFNTQNVIEMEKMFWNCYSLTSIDLSNFNTQNVVSMLDMFYNCSSLKFADISNIITDNSINIFYGLPNYCTIKINRKSIDKIGNIPSSCHIEIIDN